MLPQARLLHITVQSLATKREGRLVATARTSFLIANTQKQGRMRTGQAPRQSGQVIACIRHHQH